jgi:hypothetical protein
MAGLLDERAEDFAIREAMMWVCNTAISATRSCPPVPGFSGSSAVSLSDQRRISLIVRAERPHLDAARTAGRGGLHWRRAFQTGLGRAIRLADRIKRPARSWATHLVRYHPNAPFSGYKMSGLPIAPCQQ